MGHGRSRVRARVLAAALIGLIGLAAPPAHADPRDDARRHFLAGLALAEQKDYRGALEEFLKAQEVWPHPNTLYNIAKSYQDLGEIESALSYYRLFREAAPDRAPDVDPVIAVLEAQLAAARPAPEAPLPGASPADLARLDALALELEAISRRLRQGAPPASSGAAPGAAPGVAPGVTPDAPSGGPITVPDRFQTEAYQTEVVTASRYGQSPLDSPSSVSILTADDIRLSGATSVPELLRRVVGVEVMELSAAQPDLSIRGFNRELSNKVLVLIDGRSVYQDFLGTVLWSALPIGLADLERIEIIRGPGSAIYGANAVTGVINLITHRPGEGGQEVVFSGGSSGFRDVHTRLTGRQEQLAWEIGGGFQRRDRWSQDAPVESATVLQTFTEGDTAGQSLSQQTFRAAGQADLSVGRGLVSLGGGYAGGFTEFYTLGALGDYGFDFSAGYLRADLGFDPVHVRAFLNHIAGDAGPWWQYRGESSLRTELASTVSDLEVEWLDSFQTGPVVHRMNAGGSWRGKWIAWDYLAGIDDADADAPISEHHFALFIQEDARAGRLGLVGSLRMDRHPLVPVSQTLSPRGALIARLWPKTSLRLSAGTSFRSPTFLESYLDLPQPTAADGYYVQTSGDDELLPERILSVEAGLRDESSRTHAFDLAVYMNRVTRLIDLGEVRPATSIFDAEQQAFLAGETGFVNLGDVYTAFGVELDSSLYPADGLEFFANGAFTRILDDTGSGAPVVDTATSTWKVNAGVQYRAPFRMDFSSGLHWLSAQDWRLRSYDAAGALRVETITVPDRLIWEARVAGRPLKEEAGGSPLELAVTAWNVGALADARFQEHPKGQFVGGRIFGTVGWSF